jgi:hypothetical protein
MSERQIKVFIAIFSVLIFIGLAESILRQLGYYMTYPEQVSEEYKSQYSTEQQKIPSHPRNLSWIDENSEFSIRIQTNSYGFREREIPKDKDSSEFRIVVYGDSFIEGVGATQDSTLTRLMEYGLSGTLNDTMIKVYSFGIAGSDPFYSFYFLNQYVTEVKPDLVLMAFNITDFDDYVIRGGLERFNENGEVKFSSPISYEWVYEYSFLFRFFAHQIMGMDYTFNMPDEKLAKYKNGVAAYVNLISKVDEMGDNLGFNAVPLFYPIATDVQVSFLSDFDGGYWVQEMDVIIDSLKTSGMDYINIYDCVMTSFKTSNQLDKAYYPLDRHYNTTGYNILSDCSMNQLESLVTEMKKTGPNN